MKLDKQLDDKLFQHGGDAAGSCSHTGIKADIPSHTITELRVKEDIQEKARELADLLAQSEEVKQYRQAESKIQNHERVQQLITTVKKKQKEAVAFESFNNPDMVAKIEAEIASIQDELDGIPVVNTFQQSQSDINYLLQLVISIVRDTLTDKINMEDAKPAEDSDDCMD
ncbi:MAG: YlbF family regulator [Candidatus Pristimantibacillus lignocellulolyticus]|uniref:YlbF family regulator n=1 Tax=Candidatus Pristimantibacillus lignocellulolyticus TaxID=2994561 RepID=A0A9J6ZC30_9BACL|nr:MAG: YlbF family regulator [Candidatus Pristimantibacillus lignocellulolyticus]